jgi:2'-5' RNA ligase
MLGQVTQAIGRLMDEAEAFVFGTGLVGIFPNRFRPRTMWIGLEPSPQFQVLATKIRKALDPLVSIDTKHFLPHVTLARFKDKHPALSSVDPTKGMLPPFQILEQNRTIDSVSLYKSELTPKGPFYSELAYFALNKYVKL